LQALGRFSAISDNLNLPTTYADRPIHPLKEEKSPIMAKKRFKTATVRLYRASSKSPLRIGQTAKAALGKMKRVLGASDRAIVRVDARFKDKTDEAILDIFFDDHLTRKDMVYLSNKLLFVMNQESAVRLTGGTLECDDLGFYIDSTYFNEMLNLDTKDIPKC
jgi:hypothetical protein